MRKLWRKVRARNWYEVAVWAATTIVLVLTFAWAAGAATYQVRSGVFCTRAATEIIFEMAQADGNLVAAQINAKIAAGECVPLPASVTVGVVRTVGAFKRDVDGNWMIVVETDVVERDPRRYTIAWPGHNTDYPSPASA